MFTPSTRQCHCVHKCNTIGLSSSYIGPLSVPKVELGEWAGVPMVELGEQRVKTQTYKLPYSYSPFPPHRSASTGWTSASGTTWTGLTLCCTCWCVCCLDVTTRRMCVWLSCASCSPPSSSTHSSSSYRSFSRYDHTTASFNLNGEIRNKLNLSSEERVNIFEQNSENLMKIGWKIRKLWHFRKFSRNISWPVVMNMQMSELMMSWPHNFPFILYTE